MGLTEDQTEAIDGLRAMLAGATEAVRVAEDDEITAKHVLEQAELDLKTIRVALEFLTAMPVEKPCPWTLETDTCECLAWRQQPPVSTSILGCKSPASWTQTEWTDSLAEQHGHAANADERADCDQCQKVGAAPMGGVPAPGRVD